MADALLAPPPSFDDGEELTDSSLDDGADDTDSDSQGLGDWDHRGLPGNVRGHQPAARHTTASVGVTDGNDDSHDDSDLDGEQGSNRRGHDGRRASAVSDGASTGSELQDDDEHDGDSGDSGDSGEDEDQLLDAGPWLLPPGYSTAVDDSGQCFYLDDVTQQTSYMHPFFQTQNRTHHSTLAGHIAVVTGATSGIGLETAVSLASMGCRVVMASLSEERGRQALATLKQRVKDPDVVVLPLNLASNTSIKSFATTLQEQQGFVNILVCNAAVFGLPFTTVCATDDPHEPGLEASFVINYLGHFLLANKLVPLLRAGALRTGVESRVVMVADESHRRVQRLDFTKLPISDPASYNSSEAYNTSKLCCVLFANEFHRRYSAEGITANASCPCHLCSTNLGRHWWLYQLGWAVAWPVSSTPEQAAQAIVHTATSPRLQGLGGRYWFEGVEAAASDAALDARAARKLWDFSADLAGLSPTTEADL